jgi:hypothetical protein
VGSGLLGLRDARRISPYSRATQAGTMHAILTEDPPSLLSIRPELPGDVDSVFGRALAKSREDRYPICGEFAEALSSALGLAVGSSIWAPGRVLGPSNDLLQVWDRGDPGWDMEQDRTPTTVLPGGRLDIRLKSSFRYVHEPSRADDEALPPLGNESLVSELETQIRHSRGGTFLITGFRGVGKSTLVTRALDELDSRSGEDIVTRVSLNVARSTTTEQLLFAIVRRIFETLDNEGMMERLPPQARHALLVSYVRTSMSYSQTQSRSAQQTAGLNVGLGPGRLVKAVSDVAGPELQLSMNKSRSLATEAAFLAYSETDAEYDLMRIISLVSRTLTMPAGRRPRFRWLQRRGLAAPPRLRLVIVLDELDKLTVDDKGLAVVEELLSGTKNVLTASGAHFLVIAGPDLQDRAIRDAARGTGVYESVFSWRLYIPCAWDAPKRLIDDVLDDDRSLSPGLTEMLVNYLRFKARGVPRRLLQEFNSFVSWPNDQPRLRIAQRDLERVAFYARVEQVLRKFMEDSKDDSLFPAAIDEDRWRVGSYFAVDWVLQSRGKPFTAADLLREGESGRFDPLLRISRSSIDRLLDHLADHEVLEVVRKNDAMNTVMADVKGAADKVFCLSGDIRHRLSDFAMQGHDTHVFTRVVPSREPAYEDTFPRLVIGGRYEVSDLVSQGSLSSVYKGRDLVTGRQVTIKLLRPALAYDTVALARFRREAMISRRLDHAQVVRTLDFIDGPANFAIITERLLGQTLQDIVENEGVMQPTEVVGMGQVLTDALTYLAAEQVVRLDLKPGSIIMADRGPVIADLGIAIQREQDITAITNPGLLVGTPAFMAPELFTAQVSDTRADIYSLGIVMYYCLAGSLPWEGLPNVHDVMHAVLNEQLDITGLGISEPFRAILERATARNPDDRFDDATALGNALRETPEWEGLPVPRESGDPDIARTTRIDGHRGNHPEWDATSHPTRVD